MSLWTVMENFVGRGAVISAKSKQKDLQPHLKQPSALKSRMDAFWMYFALFYVFKSENCYLYFPGVLLLFCFSLTTSDISCSCRDKGHCEDLCML